MKLLQKYKGQLLFTLLLFLVILAAPFQDYTERTLLADEINYPEEAIGIVSKENDVITVPGGAGNIILNSDDFYFRRGTYEVTFSVSAEEVGNTAEIFDPLYVNPDNTSGRVLASAPILPGEETVSLSFTIEDYSECIELRVNSQSALELRSIYLLSERGLYRDPYIYLGLLLLGSALLLFYRTRRRIRPEVLILLSFAAVWSSIPLCFPWLLKGHDLYFHYGRLFNLAGDLFHSSFPVRFHPSLFRGFGYANSVFYPEFFLYPFALLGAAGMSPIGCYKLLLIAVNFATAGISYYAFSRLCRSRQLGLITAFLYTLSMYRLINLYTRAAVGEALATVFLPLLILGMYQLFLGDSRKWLTAVLAFTGLLQSHIITTELAIGFSAVFGICCIGRLRDRKRLARLLLAGISTVLLNLWYIIPLLQHMGYPVFALYDARNLAGYSLYASQLFDVGVSNAAGEALGRGSIAGEMPYSVGFILLIGALLFLFVCFQKHRQHPSFQIRLGKWCLALGVLSLYASSIYFPWERIQRLPFVDRIAGSIQFASRFLPFATLFLCLTSAVGIYGCFKAKESRLLLTLFCAVFVSYSAGAYFSNFTNEAEIFVSWNDQMDHAQDTDAMYLVSDNGAYASVRQINQQDTIFLPSENVTLENCSRSGLEASFTYEKAEGDTDAYVDVPFNYYPCFHAYDSDGSLLETSLGELLRLRVELPDASSGTITVRYEIPALYRVGDVISLLCAAALAALMLLSKKNHRK